MINYYELIKRKVKADWGKYKLELIDYRFDEKSFGNFYLEYKSKQFKASIRFINDRGQLFVEIKKKNDWIDIYQYLNKKNGGLDLNKAKVEEVFTLLTNNFNKDN